MKYTIEWTYGGYTTVEADSEEEAEELFSKLDLGPVEDADIVRVHEGEV